MMLYSYIDASNSTYDTEAMEHVRLKQAETETKPRVLQAGGGRVVRGWRYLITMRT